MAMSHASTVSGPAPAERAAAGAERIASLDILRGAIVVIMAIDHVRIFISNATVPALDIVQSNPALYATRWITHLCAPGFFFIAGLGVALALERGASKASTTAFLITRGLWLILLELTVLGWSWGFSIGWSWFGVIWALGASFVLLAAVVWLPRGVTAIVAAAFLAIHAYASGYVPEAWLQSGPGVLLYATGFLRETPLGAKIVLFSILPWLAVMVVGLGSGSLLAGDLAARRKKQFAAGAACLAAFVVLRITGLGSAPADAYAAQIAALDGPATTVQHVMAFLNAQKYPPSADFLLVTLGLLLVMFGVFTAADGRRGSGVLEPLRVIGRVPFLFYVLHIAGAHFLALVVSEALGQPNDHLIWTPSLPNFRFEEGFGLGLPGVYATWVVLVAALYPVCWWFGKLKDAKPHWTALRYL